MLPEVANLTMRETLAHSSLPPYTQTKIHKHNSSSCLLNGNIVDLGSVVADVLNYRRTEQRGVSLDRELLTGGADMKFQTSPIAQHSVQS